MPYLIFASILSVITLTVMLIVTPAVKTLILAEGAGFRQFLNEFTDSDGEAERLNAYLHAIPELVDLRMISADEGREMAKRIQSQLLKIEFEEEN